MKIVIIESKIMVRAGFWLPEIFSQSKIQSFEGGILSDLSKRGFLRSTFLQRPHTVWKKPLQM